MKADFETLCAEVLKGMERPRPACNKTKNCRLAGGCMDCQLGEQDPFSDFEKRRDREMDEEMRERQKKDPAFVEEQRQFVAQFLGEPLGTRT